MIKIANRHFLVFISIVGGLAILSSTMSKTPVLPLFSHYLGATPAEIGWIVMASTIPGILISFPAGVLSDLLGKRVVILASLFIFATAPFAYLLVTEVWELIAVRFYHGFATAIFGTVASAAIAERYVKDRAQKMSAFSSATIVGRSVAPFLGGVLISLASFEMVFWACGISALLALILGMMLPGEHKATLTTQARPSVIDGLKAVLKDRYIMATSMVEASQYLVFGAIEAFLALFEASLGFPAWEIGIILGVQLVSIIFVKPLMGSVSDKVGREYVIIPGLLLAGLSVLSLPYFSSLAGLTIVSAIFGIGFASVTSSTSALVADLTKNQTYGSSMGVLRTVMDIGQSVGPVLTGWMVGRYGYVTAFAILAGILTTAAVLFGYASVKYRRLE
ncbi:MFS transporter [Sulfurirhabdus autotrophica]|uniref:Putative MFS family arabinose efflux permease n=1 Tax=Sulfurirhabdus autotrophica TaxID=1706046 RepID=A0A4R3YDZ2_9PROT|nr:MFS transporter [Sulfurirhabdus autotrophica]TCV90121.1 putative MFS family arabinose efflux permease [Sulfurirhabdus autotrophica]